ncbi:hypothetical protein Dda3937_04543 [Dickeya dadantii 3937]|uniref:Uncharacterized protein n=1 Tax=Dickeya dadantii (strain 3937) TaxID=198628 RepID=E0SL61_DICD3|nr:hypothetical protein Dda3937_04543 [Dickeya dadantii 3937]
MQWYWASRLTGGQEPYGLGGDNTSILRRLPDSQNDLFAMAKRCSGVQKRSQGTSSSTSSITTTTISSAISFLRHNQSSNRIVVFPAL